MDWVVIGVGRSDCGDDAVGRAVAGALKDQVPEGVRVVECDGEAAGILDLLEGAKAAIIIDAASSGAEAGTIHRIDAAAGALPAGVLAMSSHILGLAQAIELARALGQLPPRCVVFGVEGQEFGLGKPISPAVAGSVAEVVALVKAELGAQAV